MPRILVAEDDAPLLKVIAEILECAGFEVTPARDGIEAFDQLVGNVILDLGVVRLQLRGRGGHRGGLRESGGESFDKRGQGGYHVPHGGTSQSLRPQTNLKDRRNPLSFHPSNLRCCMYARS